MIKFGTGGWRSLIGSDFIESNVKIVAEGIYKLASQQNNLDKPIAIGYDNRFLSNQSAEWIAEILTAHGIVVWLVTQSVPTPLIMHMVKKHNLHYGVEVTASHNPYSYNGIKLFVDEGRDAPVHITERLEFLINTLQHETITSMPIDKAVSYGLVKYINTPFNEFIDDILDIIDVKSIKQRGLKVLIDPMYGSGYYPLNMILNSTRCIVDSIHNNHDAYFGKLPPAPEPNTIKELQVKVVDGGYDLGIALDGDGDRLGIIDKNGRYINANEILVMLYWYLHTYKGWNGPVVKNLATTQMLDVVAESFNEKCYEVPVGFKYISKGIDDYNAVLGGESSGGLTVRGHIHGKDSIFAASLFVEMISVIGLSASEILDKLQKEFGVFEMVECNLQITEMQMARVREELYKTVPNELFNKPIVKTTTYDGLKIYFDDNSWIICRPSGTEPVLRIFAEASDSNTAEMYIQILKNYLQI